MNIPSTRRCYRLFDEMGMLAHIQAHSEQVCRVATCLADHLAKSGIPLNRELVRASALLHDITKTRSFRTHENHAETGASYLTARGYPEVGRVVAQHVSLDTYTSNAVPCEAEIVNYADKRVLHHEIKPLAERMTYILEKYGTSGRYQRRIKYLWAMTEKLEARLFGHLSFKPDHLKERVEMQPHG